MAIPTSRWMIQTQLTAEPRDLVFEQRNDGEVIGVGERVSRVLEGSQELQRFSKVVAHLVGGRPDPITSPINRDCERERKTAGEGWERYGAGRRLGVLRCRTPRSVPLSRVGGRRCR